MPSSQQQLLWTARGTHSARPHTCAPALCTSLCIEWVIQNRLTRFPAVLHSQYAHTDLSFCWQALGHAPAGVVKGRAQDWVPLCLSFLSAKGSPAQWDSADPQPADADAQAAGAQHAESPSEAALADAAGASGQVLRIGARCAALVAARTRGPFGCVASLRILHGYVLHGRQNSLQVRTHACVYGLTSSIMAGKACRHSRHHACVCPEDCGEAWRKTGSLCWQT